MKQILVVLALTISLGAVAQKSPVYQTNGVAINGYDAVAFFLLEKPVSGADSLTVNWQGANWHFSSRSNLEAFQKQPEKYAPQYGGYCAYGTAGGHKAPTQPDTWTIVDGKLYFNYNLKVKALWNKKQSAYIEQANVNWPLIKDKE